MENKYITVAFLILAIIGAIPALGWIHSKVFRRGVDFEVDFRQIVVTAVVSPNKRINNKMAVMFYGMHFVNKWTESITPKKIYFKYPGMLKDVEVTPYDIKQSVVHGKKSVGLANSVDTNILAWYDVFEILRSKKSIEPGGSFLACMVFVLDYSPGSMKKLEEGTLIIEDSLGRKSEKKIKFIEKNFDAFKKNLRIMDLEMDDGGDKIKFISPPNN